jgi:LysM repeat protein
MKKIFSKTFKFSRFTISLFTDEIMLVFIGDKKIYIKKIRLKLPFSGSSDRRQPKVTIDRYPVTPGGRARGPVRVPKRRRAFALAVALFSIGYIYSLPPYRQKSPAATDDETIKNNLLLSKQTDYSTPEKYQKLVIYEHQVVSGEYLGKIAKQYGVSVETICGTNNIHPDQILDIGKVLKIHSVYHAQGKRPCLNREKI